MSSTSDLALLSSLGAQLEDIGARITEMAERYGATPDSALAAELYGAERGVVGAPLARERAPAASPTSQASGWLVVMTGDVVPGGMVLVDPLMN